MTTRSGRGRAAPRIPLNTFAISFGIAGLAALWSTLTAALGLPQIVPLILWGGAGLAWVWLIVAHTHRGAHSTETLRSQLQHPAQGPIAAIVPAVGMLLGAELHTVWPLGGTVLALASLIAAVIFAGWMLAYWHGGNLNPEAFHGRTCCRRSPQHSSDPRSQRDSSSPASRSAHSRSAVSSGSSWSPCCCRGSRSSLRSRTP